MKEKFWMKDIWSVEQRINVHPADPGFLGVRLPHSGFWNPFIPINAYPFGKKDIEKARQIAQLIAASPKLAAACWMFAVCTIPAEIETARRLAIEALNEAGLGDMTGDDMRDWIDLRREKFGH